MSIARENPRAHSRTPLWIGLGLAVLMLLGFGTYAYVASRPKASTVTRRTIVASAVLRGDVVAPPGESAVIKAPFQAPVAKVYTSVGQRVRKGEVLLELSLPNAQAAYEQARQRVRTAETAHANGKKQWDAAVASAQQEVSAALAAERAASQPAPVAVPAPAPVAPGASGVAPVVPAPPAPVIAADPNAIAAAGQRRAQAEQMLAQVRAQAQAALFPLQQELEVARDYFQQAQGGRKLGMLRAPISGTILALTTQAGQEVGKDADEALVTIVDLEELQVQGDVSAASAGVLKPGMKATLTVKEVPNVQLEGEYKSLAVETKGVLKRRQYVALVEFENTKGLVKPGMEAQAAVALGEAKNVLAVPADAVDEDDSGRPVVKVLRQGQWVPVVVEIGLSDGQFTEVRSGLQEGETVQVEKDIL